MSNGFVFGENNSSFVYDNRIDRLISVMEQMVALQRQMVEEIRDLKATVTEAGRNRDDGLNPGRW